MNPLQALFIDPPRLLVRLLDDVHTLAQSAGSIVEMGEKLDRRADAILELGERIAGLGESIIGLGESLDQRAAAIADLGGRIEKMGAQLDSRGKQLYELGRDVNEVGKKMLPEARLVHERALDVVNNANELVAVLPTLQTAIDMALPLEGAVERLGRIVDRLPDRRRKKDATATAAAAAAKPVKPVKPRSTKPTG